MINDFFNSIPQYKTHIIYTVIIIGVFIRILKLKSKGLFLWDEAAYCREVLVIKWLIRFSLSHYRAFIDQLKHPDERERTNLLEKYRVNHIAPIAYYKFWHSLAQYISSLLFRKKDISSVIPSVVMGSLTIPIVFMVTNHLYGVIPGLCAALIISFSGLHILESRSAEPEIGASFFFLLFFSSLVLTKIVYQNVVPGQQNYSLIILILCFTGFCLAGVIEFNKAWIVLIMPVFFILETAYLFISGDYSWVMLLMSLSIPAVIAAVFVIITDVPFFLIGKVLKEAKASTITQETFNLIKLMWFRLNGTQNAADDYQVTLPKHFRWLFYIDLLRKTEGTAVLLAGIAGIVVSYSAVDPLKLYFATAGVITFLFLTYIPYKSTRASTIFVPFLSIFAAVGLSLLPPAAGLLLLAWIILRGCRYAFKIAGLKSGMKKAIDFIHSKGEKDFLCTNAPFISVYCDDYQKPNVPCHYDLIYSSWKEQNIKYIIIEHHKNFPGMSYDNSTRHITENCEPVFTVEDPCAVFYPLLAEAEFHSSSTLSVGVKANVEKWNEFRLNPSDEDKQVNVYDLQEFFTEKHSDELLCKIHNEKGIFLFKHHQYKEAVNEYKRALRYSPDNITTRFNLSICYIKLDRLNWAKKLLTELINSEKLPDDTRLDVNKYMKFISFLEHYDEADFHEALKLLYELNDFEETYLIPFYKTICHVKVKEFEPALTNARIVLQSENLPEEAENYCRTLLEKFPDRTP
ncbi:MAG TPA: tetratricopeptide repeat protein [bacterium]|nr:tetratricopeptide repeat protein [bacterium]